MIGTSIWHCKMVPRRVGLFILLDMPEHPNSITMSEVYWTSIIICACIDKLEYLTIGVDIGGQLSLFATRFLSTPAITSAKQFLFMVQYKPVSSYNELK